MICRRRRPMLHLGRAGLVASRSPDPVEGVITVIMIGRACRHGVGRGGRAVALGLIAIAALLVAATGTATSQTGTIDATCTIQSTLNFDPGLTLTPHQTRITGTGSYPLCVSPVVRSGRFTGAGSGTLSCV